MECQEETQKRLIKKSAIQEEENEEFDLNDWI